jgi:hypothetical protein
MKTSSGEEFGRDDKFNKGESNHLRIERTPRRGYKAQATEESLVERGKVRKLSARQAECLERGLVDPTLFSQTDHLCA